MHPDFSDDFLKATRKKAKKQPAQRSASRAESASIRSKSSASLDRPRDFPRDWQTAQAPPTNINHPRDASHDALNQFDFSGAAQNIGYSWEIHTEEEVTPVEQQRPIRNIFSLKKSNKPAPLDHKSHSAPDARLGQYHLPTPQAPDSPLDLQGKLDVIGTTLSSPSTPSAWPNRSGHNREQSPPPRSVFDHAHQDAGRMLSPEPASAHAYSPQEQPTSNPKLSKRSPRPNASPSSGSGFQKSHIFQVASSRSAPAISVRGPHANANLSPPTSPDMGSTYGSSVQHSRSGNSPPLSEHRNGTEAFPPSNPISRWQTHSLRSSFSTVDSELVEPIHQTRTHESEPWQPSDRGLTLQPITTTDSARSLDSGKPVEIAPRPSDATKSDSPRPFNPLASNPVDSSIFRSNSATSPTVQDNPKSFSRPELNQHHSTSTRSASANNSLYTTSPSTTNMSRPSPRIYTHHNVSDLSVDASTPSPILEESASDSGIKALDTSFKDLNHYDVSPIDEDEDFDFPSSGIDVPSYGDKSATATTRAQELERRWMATNHVR